jgi:hypothetical protein
LPPALAIRLDRHRTLEALQALPDEEQVRRQLEELNERIRKAMFAAEIGPASTTLPVDIEVEVGHWRSRR